MGQHHGQAAQGLQAGINPIGGRNPFMHLTRSLASRPPARPRIPSERGPAAEKTDPSERREGAQPSDPCQGQHEEASGKDDDAGGKKDGGPVQVTRPILPAQEPDGQKPEGVIQLISHPDFKDLERFGGQDPLQGMGAEGSGCHPEESQARAKRECESSHTVSPGYTLYRAKGRQVNGY